LRDRKTRWMRNTMDRLHPWRIALSFPQIGNMAASITRFAHQCTCWLAPAPWPSSSAPDFICQRYSFAQAEIICYSVADYFLLFFHNYTHVPGKTYICIRQKKSTKNNLHHVELQIIFCWFFEISLIYEKTSICIRQKKSTKNNLYEIMLSCKLFFVVFSQRHSYTG
jgi:hypothetical protein